ncbi:MAG: GNAT family N-acetyltransferase [Alphaproteobacteria bacterium]|nr:GNAT family N-acetyltransferase [Alphaproteobacteria bacterium]
MPSTTIYAETGRTVLRPLEKSELPRLVELLDVWEVARWLAVLPYPYTAKNAEDFYIDAAAAATTGAPQFYAIATKTDNQLIGGVALHPPRGASAAKGELEIGYWLGREYWGSGFMTEAARPIVRVAFNRPSTEVLVATTAPDNAASKNVLQKLGLRNKGVAPRDYASLRGGDMMVKWMLTRAEWNNLSA